MSKPIHPIRKMRGALNRSAGLLGPNPWLDLKEERVIARHVKPLLDALERRLKCEPRGRGYPYCSCADCRLLATWKAKL